MTTFAEWMCVETINSPPHMPAKYFKEKIADMKRLEARGPELTKAMPMLAKIIDTFLSRRFTHRFEELYYWLSRANSFGNDWNTISSRMDYLLSTSDQKALTSLSNAIRENLEKFSKISELFKAVFTPELGGTSDFEEVIDAIENNKNDWPDDLGMDYEQTMRFMTHLKAMFYEQFHYLRMTKEIGRKVQAIAEREDVRRKVYDGWTDRVVLPPHQPVEILYHTTPFVREIIQGGFKTKDELGFEILGGNTEKAISFTADIEIARAIAVSLKEAILISQGKLTVKDIMQMMQRDAGTKPAVQKWLKDSQWLADYKSYQRSILRGNPTKSTIDMAWELFRTYLALTENRYNPMFFGVKPENFKNLDVNNVGILACKCDMSKVVRYLQAMEEYRVPIGAILSVRPVAR